jgi:hypothetical protein
MLITNRNRTGHKKQVYQIVTEKPNNMNSAADPALHMVLKKKKMQRNRKESLKSWQVPWYCTRLVIG